MRTVQQLELKFSRWQREFRLVITRNGAHSHCRDSYTNRNSTRL